MNRRFRGPHRPTHETQEEAAAAALPSGKRTPGSGCGWRPSRKGDASGDLFRASCKTRAKPNAKTIRVKREDLEEIVGQALAMGECPVFVFGWEGFDWAAFPLRRAELLMKAAAAVMDGDPGEALRLLEGL